MTIRSSFGVLFAAVFLALLSLATAPAKAAATQSLIPVNGNVTASVDHFRFTS